MSEVVTLILAAGRGDRLGGPKALLEWPLEPAPGARPARSPARAPVVPLAIAHAERRLAAESSRVIVVSRKAFFTPLLAFVRPGIDLLASDADDELGPAGSLAFAVPRMGRPDRVVITPVDAVPARASTVALLLARLDAPDAPLAAKPRHQGRGGHPVVVRFAALERYAQPSPPPLRDHLRALGPACVDVEVDDPTVLADLDKPADVVRVLGSLPRFFPFKRG